MYIFSLAKLAFRDHGRVKFSRIRKIILLLLHTKIKSAPFVVVENLRSPVSRLSSIWIMWIR